MRQAQEGLYSVQIFSQIKTIGGGMFREKIFFDFYFFVWLVQTLTKTFFNSDNGETFFNSKILLFNFISAKKPNRKK